MLNFSFRLWFEEEEEKKRRPVQDASGVAQRWMGAIPPASDHPQNDAEVWKFVEAMADPKKNASAIHRFMMKLPFPPETRYGPRKIAGTLLMTNSPLLKTATGEIVFNVKQAMFAFGIEDPVKGKLIIAHPPMSFNHTDRALLAGIIQHELRHASDFVALGGDTSGVGGTGELAQTDTDAYLSNIVEARAYSDQLRWLLRLMGNNPQMVISALGASGFGMDPDMKKCAEYFLEEFVKSPKMHEGLDVDYHNFKHTAMPPTMHVGSMSGMGDKRQAEKAASLVAAIMDSLRFQKNVKVPFRVST